MLRFVQNRSSPVLVDPPTLVLCLVLKVLITCKVFRCDKIHYMYDLIGVRFLVEIQILYNEFAVIFCYKMDCILQFVTV